MSLGQKQLFMIGLPLWVLILKIFKKAFFILNLDFLGLFAGVCPDHYHLVHHYKKWNFKWLSSLYLICIICPTISFCCCCLLIF